MRRIFGQPVNLPPLPKPSETGLAVAIGEFKSDLLFVKPGDVLTIQTTADGSQIEIFLNNLVLMRMPGEVLLRIESGRKRTSGKVRRKSRRVKKPTSTSISGMFE